MRFKFQELLWRELFGQVQIAFWREPFGQVQRDVLVSHPEALALVSHLIAFVRKPDLLYNVSSFGDRKGLQGLVSHPIALVRKPDSLFKVSGFGDRKGL